MIPDTPFRAGCKMFVSTNQEINKEHNMNTPPHGLHAAQQVVYASPARFKVVACGRRWGKTELGKRIAVEIAQQGKTVWWISPNYGVSLDVWRAFKDSLAEQWETKNEQ